MVRAVCVDAHERICAGCALKAHGIQSPEMEAAAKLTASMHPKDSMGTREIRQAQAWLVGSDKLKRRGRSEGLTEVRLPDSTLRSGEPATWGSGQQKLNCSWET